MQQSGLHPYSSVPSGVGSTSISTSRVHLLSHLLLGGRGLVLGYLRSLSSLLPAWAGGGDFHPHASWRASFLAAQVSARAP